MIMRSKYHDSQREQKEYAEVSKKETPRHGGVIIFPVDTIRIA